MQLADQVSSIVQTSVPSKYRTRRQNMWLRFAVRLFCGAKRAIEDCHTVSGVGLIAIGAIGGERCADFVDIVLCGRWPFEIPSSELHAHDLLPCFPFDLNMFLVAVLVDAVCANFGQKAASSS